ncbi:hypothetical protein [Nocardioides sp. R-C-SC26]|uniref:hypothetical protein n=1 Tax=Nocardioides sp. R-C-SC26 TaxID=2870414 RepID=UPI001E35CDDE|nr:hypothetical protein [Nocardioides sp. R-C-SC26]
MGLLSSILGGRPGEHAVNETVRDAVRVLPGVRGHDVTYRHGPNRTGEVSGRIEVADLPTYLDALQRIHGVLAGLLGSRADAVEYAVTANLADGTARTPAEVGLRTPCTGAEIAARLR